MSRPEICSRHSEIDGGIAPDYLTRTMSTNTRWGKRSGLLLAVTGLAFAQTHCSSARSDLFVDGGAANSGGAGGKSSGGAAGTVIIMMAGAAGMAEHPSAGAAGEAEGGAGGEDTIGNAGQGGDSSVAVAGAGGATPSDALEFVFDHQVLPSSGIAFAADIDGDGTGDNAYGQVLAVLSIYGFPAQSSADAETSAGRGLQLLALHAADTTLESGAATLNLWRAQQTSPDFTGTGSFIVDGAAPSANLNGQITSEVLTSVKFQAGERLPRILLHLPFGNTVDLPLSVYSISFHVAANGLSQGQLSGAVSVSDMNAVVPPALAAQFDTVCAGATTPIQECQTALLLFDTDQDQHISADELRASDAIQAVLTPDIKIFDDQGNFAPDPAAEDKDALSVGFGFSAVRAHITP